MEWTSRDDLGCLTSAASATLKTAETRCPNCGGRPHHGLRGKRVCSACHFHYFARVPKPKGLTRASMVRRTRIAPMSSWGREFRRAWRLLKEQILRRDHGRCRYCGAYAIDAHHVVKRSQSRDLLLTRDNLVSLCRDCHTWTDAAGLSARGRLVITALGGERFRFHIQETDKFTARALGRADELGTNR